MITLVVNYVIRPGHEQEAEGFLRELRTASRSESGCRTYEVHRSLEEPRAFLIFEQYDDQAALEAHRETPHFLQFGRNGLQTIMESRTAGTFEPFV
jgi:autoinducer 2-degrading protein